VNGAGVPDPDLGDHPDAPADPVPPVHAFRAHNAPLGMTFVRGDDLPAAYRNAALVALHGSWNRTRMDGYRVVSLHWTGTGIQERDFAVGFENEGRVIGRPVDVAEGPDGAFYVSDDYAGAIYRIAHGEPGSSPRALAATRASGSGDPLAGLDASERAARAARGEALFEQHDCGSCHRAEGAPPGMVVKPLAALGGRHDLDGLTRLLRTPQPPMPALPMGEEERRDLAVYLLARYGEEQP
jgi:mono/diheme cytochrome c family protein